MTTDTKTNPVRLSVGTGRMPTIHGLCSPLLWVDEVAAHVAALGILRHMDSMALAWRIRDLAREQIAPRIVLYLGLYEGEVAAVNWLASALEDAAGQVELVAVLHFGCGPSLRLASHCHRTYCPGDAAIGEIGHFSRQQQGLEVEREISRANQRQRMQLAAWRPALSMRVWHHLETEWIVGEQAEAIGLVDGLVPRDIPLSHDLIRQEDEP